RSGPQDATYMYYSTRHWKPVVNGYSGFAPASYLALRDRLRRFPDDAAIEALRQAGVTYLLVHSVFYIRGDFDADIRALDARRDVRRLGVFAWRGGGSTVAFEILK